MFFSQGSPPFPSRVVFCTKRSPHRVLWGHILHLGRPPTHTLPPQGASGQDPALRGDTTSGCCPATSCTPWTLHPGCCRAGLDPAPRGTPSPPTNPPQGAAGPDPAPEELPPLSTLSCRAARKDTPHTHLASCRARRCTPAPPHKHPAGWDTAPQGTHTHAHPPQDGATSRTHWPPFAVPQCLAPQNMVLHPGAWSCTQRTPTTGCHRAGPDPAPRGHPFTPGSHWAGPDPAPRTPGCLPRPAYSGTYRTP